MRVLVTGATGFVGKRLVRRLALAGHEVVVLSRNPSKAKEKLPEIVDAFDWKPTREEVPAAALSGVDGIIHLAGEGIAEKRWSSAQKEKIYQSRILGTRTLVNACSKMSTPPKAFVSASAIGFYGDRENEKLTEKSHRGNGFLSDVCVDWEKELDHLPSEVRRAAIRIGIVMGPDGGMLKKLLPLFKTGLAGPVGNGKQWMSWIHVEDLVSLFVEALENEKIQGPVNGVAPEPVTNKEFTKALANALHRPAFLPAPAFALKLAMGEMAQLALGSQKVIPEVAQSKGFQFKYPHISGAMEEICGKKKVNSIAFSGSQAR